ncbi:MAG: hypothetical protein ACYCW6_32025 [Candidatus Xenobia bacterium]
MIGWKRIVGVAGALLLLVGVACAQRQAHWNPDASSLLHMAALYTFPDGSRLYPPRDLPVTPSQDGKVSTWQWAATGGYPRLLVQMQPAQGHTLQDLTQYITSEDPGLLGNYHATPPQLGLVAGTQQFERVYYTASSQVGDALKGFHYVTMNGTTGVWITGETLQNDVASFKLLESSARTWQAH